MLAHVITTPLNVSCDGHVTCKMQDFSYTCMVAGSPSNVMISLTSSLLLICVNLYSVSMDMTYGVY